MHSIHNTSKYLTPIPLQIAERHDSNYMIVTDGSTESVRGSSLAMQRYVSTLHVVRAHSYDNGTYVCIATNFWDSYFAEASINVIGKITVRLNIL